MCYDMQTTKQSMSSSVASVNTRDINFSKDHHNVYPVIDISEEYRIDTKPFVNRPFFVDSVEWSNQAPYTFLTSKIKQLPRDVFTSNLSLETALKMGSFFRSDLSLNVSVAGTIAHAGTILVGVLPPMPYTLIESPFIINSIMSGPHCFLNANEATSCVLHVPWYCNTDVASLDMKYTAPATETAVGEGLTPGNFATLVLFVLNPLSVSDSASIMLNITIEACFSSLDIFVPSPKFLQYDYTSQGLQSIATTAIDATTSYTKQVVGDAIDVIRAGIRRYTGLHNPNVPLITNRMIATRRNFPNNTTGEQFFEKLDPYPEIDRIVDRPIFNTEVDEMSIRHILSKPQYLGTCKVYTDDKVGTLVWARPISPFQGGLAEKTYPVSMSNNIELFHRISRAWRGSLNIHVQSVMNNKQQVKLRLIQMYNPSSEVLFGRPEYAGLLSAPSHLMEFTGGGQIQTINIPYLCRNQLTPCTPDMSTEALFHGMYYLFVAQPLVISSDSPKGVSFNIYMSGGDDLSFHGYSTEPLRQLPLVNPILEQSEVYTSQGLTVMNEPQKDDTLTTYSEDINTSEKFQERLYSPIDIRPIIRRMYQSEPVTIVTGPNVINLNTLIGERLKDSVEQVNVPQLLSAMYYGKSLGLKIKLKVFGSSTSGDLSVAFAPPQTFCNHKKNIFQACKVSPLNVFGPIASPSGKGYPFPFIEMANMSHGSTSLYEFTIPNTSLYKFIGGPEKYGTTESILSIADFGHLVIWSTYGAKAVLFAGYTDESRLGFHSIAPNFAPTPRMDTIVNSGTAYLGSSNAGPDIAPSNILNPFIYVTKG